MRFYSPKSGEIFIDGTSTETLDINWLRNNITLVQQQSILFNESIFRNIAFGQRDYLKVRKDHIKKPIELAMLQHTINDMPHGLDTTVGTDGSALSGGQRQRIAIARARLRDTPVLILDESTSALDYISRTLVLDAIREWRQGKTTIIITHDMSQILEDDFVYILENGRIIEEGYRRNLESLDSSKFTNGLLPTIALATHPKEEQTSHSDTPASSRPNTRDSLARNFSRPVFKTKDSLHVRIRPKSIIVPTLYGQQEEGRPYRRLSGGLLSPLSPCPYYGQPPSSANSPSLLSPGKQQRLALISPSHLSPPDGVEMIEMHGIRSRISRVKNDINTWRGSENLESRIASASKTARSRRRGRKLSKIEKERRIAPIKKILLTVWPNLRWKDRSLLILGFIGALIHAAATPVFSWVFSKLLGTFFLQEHRSQRALVWSLSILGVAFADAIASFFMHYLLEKCGQAWVDRLRVEAMKRVLDQPRQWFDRDKNSHSKLTACLDRNAEEMRNLVGRFAGFVFVAAAMTGMAVVWSTILCWKLTLIGLASSPALYAVTRVFDAVSARWERRSNDAGEVAGSIFADTFSDIRTVRALTLESYFHKKYSRATSKAMVVGFKRSAYSGLFFGLSDSGIIFVTGKSPCILTDVFSSPY
jgi:ATP-binding cassette, subfamily B (MDR/TAP), member 1